MTTGDLVSTLIAHVAATLPGWRASEHEPEAFADAADGAERVHQSYVVWSTATTPLQTRQPRGGQLSLVVSRVSCRWLYRVRPGYRSVDYPAALAAELSLLSALLSGDALVLAAPRVDGPLTRVELPAATGGHLVLGEINLQVQHTITM